MHMLFFFVNQLFLGNTLFYFFFINSLSFSNEKITINYDFLDSTHQILQHLVLIFFLMECDLQLL